ncbi:PfkB family carbohydrate kinase [Reichenbachiella carrageenanivorans]|uniref:PfkB family carbohydrate kinase n=1 Tax=Reichenbachiella carrageenanivorans TaxID=2979869 RepID=A0ABY6D4A4_9BACT|nr:PfkB family carbohydrate kinase [Reichenbachiella carrageenanivorans]UXX80976.1 PfkB family carbohydrate kinase [Reichenbachiella carrageenanivorans]
MSTLQVNHELAYNYIVGIGGIGSGMLFSLQGSHNLGRNESRLATLEPSKDFCKQHIIMHYLAVLLGAQPHGRFQSFPIGKVGQDDVGKELYTMMRQVGMSVEGIAKSTEKRTLFSVCYQYSNFEGGNITTDNSASSEVIPADIERFFYDKDGLINKRGMTLAAPEVGIDARLALLTKGREMGLFNVAAVLSSEVLEFEKSGGFEMVDLLAVNIDEAQHIAQKMEGNRETKVLVDSCLKRLQLANPNIILLVTDGGHGSYVCQRDRQEFVPAIETEVVSTAGAGDAFLSGTLTGICSGLPLFRQNDNVGLHTAVELGTLVASMSVTSADTIHLGLDADSLRAYAQSKEIKIEFFQSKSINR